MNHPAEAVESEQLDARVEVTRDITFSRHAADVGLVIDLGRDVELAFLQFGPCVSARVAKNDEDGDAVEGYEFSPGTTEVARVRMAGASAIQLSLLIIDRLVESRKVDTEKLKETIYNMFSSHSIEDSK